VHVFISWSGDRGRAVAEVLRKWLPTVLQTLDVWMSESDIEKGADWDQEIAEHLRRADEGIVCLTPENLGSPWLLFEAGAISNQVKKARVCTYLYDLRPQDVPQPLGRFQHTIAEQADTLKLPTVLNQRSKKSLAQEQLERLFEATWPDVARQLREIPKAIEPVPAERPVEEMIGEVLDLVRSRSATDPSSAIIAKLQYIELALFMLSFRTIGKSPFDEVALNILAAGRQHYRVATPGDEAFNSIWTLFEGIVKKKSVEKAEDAGLSIAADEIAAKAASTSSEGS
jgi:hypothetical protein